MRTKAALFCCLVLLAGFCSPQCFQNQASGDITITAGATLNCPGGLTLVAESGSVTILRDYNVAGRILVFGRTGTTISSSTLTVTGSDSNHNIASDGPITLDNAALSFTDSDAAATIGCMGVLTMTDSSISAEGSVNVGVDGSIIATDSNVSAFSVRFASGAATTIQGGTYSSTTNFNFGGLPGSITDATINAGVFSYAGEGLTVTRTPITASTIMGTVARAVSFTNSPFTADTVMIGAADGFTFTDSGMTVVNDVSITGNGLTMISSPMTSTSGAFQFNLGMSITLTQSSVTALGDISLGIAETITLDQSPLSGSAISFGGDDFNATDSPITGTGEIQIGSRDGIDLTNSDVSGTEINLGTSGAVTATDSDLAATGALTVGTATGITIVGSEMQGTVTRFTSGGSVSFTNSSLLEATSIFAGMAGDLNVTNTDFQATDTINFAPGGDLLLQMSEIDSASVDLFAEQGAITGDSVIIRADTLLFTASSTTQAGLRLSGTQLAVSSQLEIEAVGEPGISIDTLTITTEDTANIRIDAGDQGATTSSISTTTTTNLTVANFGVGVVMDNLFSLQLQGLNITATDAFDISLRSGPGSVPFAMDGTLDTSTAALFQATDLDAEIGEFNIFVFGEVVGDLDPLSITGGFASASQVLYLPPISIVDVDYTTYSLPILPQVQFVRLVITEFTLALSMNAFPVTMEEMATYIFVDSDGNVLEEYDILTTEDGVPLVVSYRISEFGSTAQTVSLHRNSDPTAEDADCVLDCDGDGDCTCCVDLADVVMDDDFLDEFTVITSNSPAGISATILDELEDDPDQLCVLATGLSDRPSSGMFDFAVADNAGGVSDPATFRYTKPDTTAPTTVASRTPARSITPTRTRTILGASASPSPAAEPSSPATSSVASSQQPAPSTTSTAAPVLPSASRTRSRSSAEPDDDPIGPTPRPGRSIRAPAPIPVPASSVAPVTNPAPVPVSESDEPSITFDFDDTTSGATALIAGIALVFLGLF